jgi:hypothetical protein
MNIRDEDQVSAVALVVESEAETAASVAGDAPVSVADDDIVGDAAAAAAATTDTAPDDAPDAMVEEGDGGDADTPDDGDADTPDDGE